MFEYKSTSRLNLYLNSLHRVFNRTILRYSLVSGSSGRVRVLGGVVALFLGKTLYSHSASLHPGVCIHVNDTGKNAGGNPAMDYHPIQAGVEILLAASCYRNRDMHWR